MQCASSMTITPPDPAMEPTRASSARSVEVSSMGVGGTRAGLGPLALQRLQQRRLLAADVGAVAAVDLDVEREVAAERPLAEDALRAELGDGVGQQVVRQVVLAADVDPGLVGADR